MCVCVYVCACVRACVCVCVCVGDRVSVCGWVLFEEYNMMTMSLMIFDLSIYMLLLIMSCAKSAPLLVRWGVVEMTVMQLPIATLGTRRVHKRCRNGTINICK